MRIEVIIKKKTIVVSAMQHFNRKTGLKKFAKFANITNYVLPLPMIQSFHGNTF